MIGDPTEATAERGKELFESMVGAYLGALYQDPVMFCLLIGVALWQSRHIRFGGTRRA